MLAPASQQAAPEPLYVAVHQGCPSASAAISRVIQAVTMAGSTAVVTETGSGAAGALGSVTDAWSYAGGRWGIELSPSATASYSHGGAAADIAALKAAGECGAPEPLQTIAPASAQPSAVRTLPTLPTIPADTNG